MFIVEQYLILGIILYHILGIKYMWRGLVLVSFLVCNLRYGCFLYSKNEKVRQNIPKSSRKRLEGLPKAYRRNVK